MDKWLKLKPLDSVMSRDGRPFDAAPGSQAHTLRDLSPGTVAGTLRTMLGKEVAYDRIARYAGMPEAIRRMQVRGPIYEKKGRLMFPWPQDIYAYEKLSQLKLQSISPTIREWAAAEEGFLGTGKGGHFEEELWSPELPVYSKEWKQTPAYLSEERMMAWLTAPEDRAALDRLQGELMEWKELDARQKLESNHYMAAFPIEQREHTEIDERTLGAREQRLFTTRYLAFPQDVHALAAVRWPDQVPWPQGQSAIHSLGGKRRLVHVQELTLPPKGLRPSEELLQALQSSRYIRLVLATPAFFQKGWLPGWVDEELRTKEGWLGRASGVRLKLRWACVSGYVPISGWSYSKEKEKESEKSVRRLVPAGSVYFFEVEEGDPSELAKQVWLKSVSDPNRRKAAFDGEDGCGLALWGTWSPRVNQANVHV